MALLPACLRGRSGRPVCTRSMGRCVGRGRSRAGGGRGHRQRSRSCSPTTPSSPGSRSIAATCRPRRPTSRRASKRFADGVRTYGVDCYSPRRPSISRPADSPKRHSRSPRRFGAQTARVRYLFGSRARSVFLVRLAVAVGRDELAADVRRARRRLPPFPGGSARRSGPAQPRPGRTGPRPHARRRGEVPGDPAAARPRRLLRSGRRVLAAARRTDEAVELLQEASTINADIEAVADAARVDAALLALGADAGTPARAPPLVRVGLADPDGDLTSAGSPPRDSPTPRSAPGLYISRRTVETHLSHVFRKVGRPGRTHLAAELTRPHGELVEATHRPGSDTRPPPGTRSRIASIGHRGPGRRVHQQRCLSDGRSVIAPGGGPRPVDRTRVPDAQHRR